MKILMTWTSSFVRKHLIPLLEDAGYVIYHLLRETKGFQRESIWDFQEALPEDIPVCDLGFLKFVGLYNCKNLNKN